MELTTRQMDIVNAAISIIATKGYESFTTKNLAESLDLSEAALYRHFNSKRELVSMVLDYFGMLSNRVIDEIKQSPCSSLDCIRRFVLNRYELFSANPDLAKVMFSEELFRNDPSFTEQFQAIMHVHKKEVEAFIEQAKAENKIRAELPTTHVFRVIVGSMRLIVSQWNLSGGAFDLQLEGKELLETIISMIEVKK